mgnify:CR=1 FL=1
MKLKGKIGFGGGKSVPIVLVVAPLGIFLYSFIVWTGSKSISFHSVIFNQLFVSITGDVELVADDVLPNPLYTNISLS